jgi:hypothetical protein
MFLFAQKALSVYILPKLNWVDAVHSQFEKNSIELMLCILNLKRIHAYSYYEEFSFLVSSRAI